MRTTSRSLLPLAAGLAILFGAVHAEALTVQSASLSNGVVSVSGGKAARGAPISWQGTIVTTAKNGGSFSFKTADVPANCVGMVSDGVATIAVVISGCGGTVSPLPPTGQTLSYAAGDDGYYNGARPLSYTDNGDGTVTDNHTGLMWEMKTTQNVNDVYNWYAALDYVAGLNAMNGGVGFAGYNDWRLPNMRELHSIVDFTQTDPPINPVFGPTKGILNSVAFWSSTSASVSGQSNAWSVDFTGQGTTLVFAKASSLRVRAVRGGR